jgi:hypothetical protein
MLGGRWFDDQKRAYRSFITIGRIADDSQGVGLVVGMTLLLMFVSGHRRWVFLGAFIAISALAQFGVPVLFPRLLPAHLRRRLAPGRFDGPMVRNAPHTYVDLVRMWRDPLWECQHSFEAASRPAPVLANLLYILSILGIAAGTAAAQLHFADRISSLPIFFGGLCGSALEVLAMRSFGNYVARARLTSPAFGERATVAVVGLLVIALSTTMSVLLTG